MAIIVVSLVLGEAIYLVPSVAIEACLYWPIRQILQIRKENIALATAPMLIATLSPEHAAGEMVKLLENVRG